MSGVVCAFEEKWRARGMASVAGVDEVGRGPWAGPVVAAAVVVPDDAGVRAALLGIVNDSKKLGARKRELVAALVQETCVVCVAEASVAEIDMLNIRQATLLAMRRAVEGLATPCAVLVDGRDVPETLVGEAIVKGDGCELCIACASVVAKVYRDNYMKNLAKAYPVYGWERNAGYGTADHQKGLLEHGVSEHHRRSFAPVRALLGKVA